MKQQSTSTLKKIISLDSNEKDQSSFYSNNKLNQYAKQYQKLKQEDRVPQQMKIKLDYLLYKSILKKTQSNSNSQAQESFNLNKQKQQLYIMKRQERINLFCKIIKCLSGQQLITYFDDQKIYLFKQKTFSKWANNVYLTFDSQKLIAYEKNKPKSKQLTQNKKIIFQIKNKDLRVSKTFEKFDKKIVIGIIDSSIKKKYLIGFKNQVTCQRIHQFLFNNTKRKKEKIDTLLDFPQPQNNHININQEATQQPQIQPQIINNQLNDFWEKAMKLFQHPEFELTNNSQYSNIKNFKDGSGRFLVHNSNRNRLKTILFLNFSEKFQAFTDSQFIFQNYLQKITQWNKQIDEITSLQYPNQQSSNNTKRYKIKFKRYSMMSYQREAIIDVQLTPQIKQNKFVVSYLVIYPMIEQKSVLSKMTSTIQAQFRQIFQFKKQINSDVVSITILSQIDFKGHNSDQDKKNMNFKINASLQGFEQFLKKDKDKWIKRKQVQNLKSDKQIKEKIVDKQITSSRGSKYQKQKTNYQQFIQMLKFQNQDYTDQFANKFISFIVQQKMSQKYYLNKRFIQIGKLDLNKNLASTDKIGNYVFKLLPKSKDKPAWRINQQFHVFQYIDYQFIQANKHVGSFLVKQVGSNLLSGKSILNISLPVEIFDKKSNLERIAMASAFVPRYLSQAGQLTDPVQQMKKIVLLYTSLPSLSLLLRKPFNPILGQTFQCLIAGIPFYVQQISHHPPISAFYMKTESFEYYGQSAVGINLGFNTVYGKQHHFTDIKFLNTKTHFRVFRNQSEFTGVIYGPKLMKFIGKEVIHQMNYHYHAEYSYGSDCKKLYQSEQKMKPNDIIGGIFKVTPKYSEKVSSKQALANYSKNHKIQTLKSSDIEEKFCKISGNWSESIYFDGKEAKKLLDPAPNNIQYLQSLLPSHSNFREDLIYRKTDNLKLSQQAKQKMENTQRRDKKLRQQYLKKHKNK